MFELFLSSLLPLVVQIEVKNDVEGDATKGKSTKRFKMWTVLHEDLVIVVVDDAAPKLPWSEER